jgi:hypothetical protein
MSHLPPVSQEEAIISPRAIPSALTRTSASPSYERIPRHVQYHQPPQRYGDLLAVYPALLSTVANPARAREREPKAQFTIRRFTSILRNIPCSRAHGHHITHTRRRRFRKERRRNERHMYYYWITSEEFGVRTSGTCKWVRINDTL